MELLSCFTFCSSCSRSCFSSELHLSNFCFSSSFAFKKKKKKTHYILYNRTTCTVWGALRNTVIHIYTLTVILYIKNKETVMCVKRIDVDNISHANKWTHTKWLLWWQLVSVRVCRAKKKGVEGAGQPTYHQSYYCWICKYRFNAGQSDFSLQ